MKKTILAVLLVLVVATPCFAQEVETDGIFSIEGTLWQSLPIAVGMVTEPFIPIPLPIPGFEFSIGFDGGEVYPPAEGFITNGFYQDFLVASIFGFKSRRRLPMGYFAEATGFGILQPIGIGMLLTHYTSFGVPSQGTMMILIKVDNDWTPPEGE